MAVVRLLVIWSTLYSISGWTSLFYGKKLTNKKKTQITLRRKKKHWQKLLSDKLQQLSVLIVIVCDILFGK